MFAPRYGIDEESATGTAASPLGALLLAANHDVGPCWIEQGRFMTPSSPSRIEVVRANDQVHASGRAQLAEISPSKLSESDDLCPDLQASASLRQALANVGSGARQIGASAVGSGSWAASRRLDRSTIQLQFGKDDARVAQQIVRHTRQRLARR
ncbi:MAG: hypothetical protein CFE44_19535 [Burkholderiales bacterium PBB4]|nr:MAG: hypothetical protein CFE44_19535 [Burkholderiales bacterium PBB4]